LLRNAVEPNLIISRVRIPLELLAAKRIGGERGIGSGALAAFGQDLKPTPKGETQIPISKWLENRHSACGDLRPQCQKRRRQPREALNAPEPNIRTIETYLDRPT
jgi:hypothetical protein